jgi:aspartyl-tRNA(Asn)/glutamyl-tRNA(Gln) amidotransferase subunit B
MGPIKNYLNEHAVHITDFPLSGAKIAEIIALIDSNTISFSAASQTLFPKMLENPMANAGTLAADLNLIQESNADQLEEWVAQAIAMYPEKVDEYRNGKKGLIGLFMGEVMKISKGKADPKQSNELLRIKLES